METYMTNKKQNQTPKDESHDIRDETALHRINSR